jgi:hypothetical protein
LQAAELLYEASLFPELEYTFKHALTHDVAYKPTVCLNAIALVASSCGCNRGQIAQRVAQ